MSAAVDQQENKKAPPSGGSPEILMIEFEKFASKCEFPRNPDDANLTTKLSSIDTSECFMVFLSHCWLRGSPSSEGFDGWPHPDNEAHEKFDLTVAAIDKTWKYFAPGMKKCYLWADYCCINQDVNPAGELKNLDMIMQACDCLLTPIIDKKCVPFDHQGRLGPDFFKIHFADDWNVGPKSYLHRGWCRLEMFYAVTIPLKKYDDASRVERFACSIRAPMMAGRRPHLLYSTKLHLAESFPMVLPPLQYSYFEEFSPTIANFSVDSDREEVKLLVSMLDDRLPPPIQPGYVGDVDEEGLKHGYGRATYENGSYYEGEFVHGKKQGKGKSYNVNGFGYAGEFVNDLIHGSGQTLCANGNIYTGDYFENEMTGFATCQFPDMSVYIGGYLKGSKHGSGKMKYANGDVYEGAWETSNRHGSGTMKYANGDVYEGAWEGNHRHGSGTMKYANGDVYEGAWEGNHRHGSGTMKYANGDVYEGAWEGNHRHGSGTMKYADGDRYMGMWFKGVRQGEGCMRYGNGDAYEGSWELGMREGRGSQLFANGDLYDGEFHRDQMHGRGSLRVGRGKQRRKAIDEKEEERNSNVGHLERCFHSCEISGAVSSVASSDIMVDSISKESYKAEQQGEGGCSGSRRSVSESVSSPFVTLALTDHHVEAAASAIPAERSKEPPIEDTASSSVTAANAADDNDDNDYNNKNNDERNDDNEAYEEVIVGQWLEGRLLRPRQSL